MATSTEETDLSGAVDALMSVNPELKKPVSEVETEEENSSGQSDRAVPEIIADTDTDREDLNGGDPQPEDIQFEEPDVADPSETDLDPQILDGDYDDVLVQVGDDRVSIKDLKQGTLMQADYTRKTQELAETRRKLELENQELLQDMQQRQQLLTQYTHTIGKPVEPDWFALSKELSPENYIVQQAAYKKHVDGWQKQADNLAEYNSRSQEQFREATSRVFLDKFPVFEEDSASYQTTHSERAKIATEFSFTQPEIAKAVDMRVVSLLEEVRCLRDTVSGMRSAPERKGKPKVVRVQKGGSSRSGGSVEAAKLAKIRKRVRDPSRPLNVDEAASALLSVSSLRKR